MTQHHREPSELEIAIYERGHTAGLAAIGPLTQEQAAREEAYIAWLDESELEEASRVAAGGRTICPSCGQRSVTHRSVATYGGGLPGSEYSDLAECERERCSYRSL